MPGEYVGGQHGIARRPGTRLEVGAIAHGHRVHGAGHAEDSGRAQHERSIIGRSGAQPVIDMGDGDNATCFDGQQGERRRVGAAGDGTRDRGARWGEGAPGEQSSDAFGRGAREAGRRGIHAVVSPRCGSACPGSAGR